MTPGMARDEQHAEGNQQTADKRAFGPARLHLQTVNVVKSVNIISAGGAVEETTTAQHLERHPCQPRDPALLPDTHPVQTRALNCPRCAGQGIVAQRIRNRQGDKTDANCEKGLEH